MFNLFRRDKTETPPPPASLFEMPAEVQLEVQEETKLLPFASMQATSELTTDQETQDTIQTTPLHKAAAKGDLREVNALLAAGADLNAKDALGRIPLQVASSATIRDMLVKEGWKRDADAIFVAIETHQNERLDWLLDQDLANPNKAAKVGKYIGQQPLFHAAQCGNADAVRILVDNGANPNLPNGQGDLPLMWAARLNKIDCMRALLECGADPNKEGDRLKTRPIHVASMKSLSLLLEYRADPTVKDSVGRDALARAIFNDRPEVVATLKQVMGV